MSTVIHTLPIHQAEPGPVFDRVNPHHANDRAFAEWEAPLVWHHQKSYLEVDEFFRGRRCLHFAFERRVPEEVWFIGWHLWYDNALVHKTPIADGVLRARLGYEETTFGYGGDNQEHVGAWVGIVARMQDLRRYYFLTLEYPRGVVLYRRQDDQWTEIASRQVHLDVWTEYELTLEMNGQMFTAILDGEPLFTAADYTWGKGWCGLRASCTSAVTEFTIEADRTSRISTVEEPRDEQTDASLPEPVVLREIDCSAHGKLSKTIRHNASVSPVNALGTDRPQLLVDLFDAPDGSTHVLMDEEGHVLWKTALPGAGRVLPAAPRDDGGQDFYVVTPEELMRVDGRTGEVLQRAEAPLSSTGRKPAAGNGPFVTADLDGTGRRDHFFVTYGANGEDIVAIRPDLSVRWHVETAVGNGHGHHHSACDVDGDGREEIFAGCMLLSADGETLWKQEEILRRLKVPNGGHVDSSVMGFFAGGDGPPTLHMASSSAGHLVCDARTGELLAAHPQGHAQSITAGVIVPGSEQMHVISTNRWGSYGVTGVYDALGRRVSRFTPGFVCQHTIPLNWTGGPSELLLVCDGPGYRGIYDHFGRRLIELDSLVPYSDPFAQRYDRAGAFVAPLADDPRDVVILRVGQKLRLIAPSGDAPSDARLRVRRTNVSWLR